MMRWVLWTPQILETADDVSREQLVQELITHKVIHGAADAFELYPVQVWTADAECSAPNGAAGEESKELNATGRSGEK